MFRLFRGVFGLLRFVALACVADSAIAQQCVTNFSVTGTRLTGLSYGTSALVPSVDLESTFRAVQQAVSSAGWRISTVDQGAHAVLAQNSLSTASGRVGTLGVSAARLGDQINLALLYNNPPGVESPVDAARQQLCKIVELASARSVPQDPKPADSIAASTAASGAIPTVAEPLSGLCLAKACLGMTVGEVALLPLQPAGTFKFTFASRLSNAYGIGSNGDRVVFSDMGDLDSKTAAQFAKSIKTICSMSFASAKLKASDGQPIHLVLIPQMRNGVAALVVTQIDRQLPPAISDSELKRFEAAARNEYGEAFRSDSYGMSRVPSAQIHFDAMQGRSLRLQLPTPDIRNAMMEQPGCSEKVRLD